jgi:hypothetical protein
MKTYVHLSSDLAEYFLAWEMFHHKSFVENQNTFYVQ